MSFVGLPVMNKDPSYKKRESDRGASLGDYWPLASLIGISLLTAGSITLGLSMGTMHFMHFCDVENFPPARLCGRLPDV